MNSFKIFTQSSRFFFFKKKKVAFLDGELVFLNDRIIIKDKTLGIDSVKSVCFNVFDDYSGKVISTNRKSEGYKNEVDIIANEGEKFKVYFQLTDRYQIRDIREQLISYHNSGKLAFENLIAILDIEDYNAIQNFKRTLTQSE